MNRERTTFDNDKSGLVKEFNNKKRCSKRGYCRVPHRSQTAIEPAKFFCSFSCYISYQMTETQEPFPRAEKIIKTTTCIIVLDFKTTTTSETP
jgi:hypothetical protein